MASAANREGALTVSGACAKTNQFPVVREKADTWVVVFRDYTETFVRKSCGYGIMKAIFCTLCRGFVVQKSWRLAQEATKRILFYQPILFCPWIFVVTNRFGWIQTEFFESKELSTFQLTSLCRVFYRRYILITAKYIESLVTAVMRSVHINSNRPDYFQVQGRQSHPAYLAPNVAFGIRNEICLYLKIQMEELSI